MQKIKILLYLIILTLTFGLLFYTTNSSGDVIYKDINTTLKSADILGSIEDGNTIEAKVDGELLFLTMGVDAENTTDKVRNGIRTDTMILVKVDFNQGEINLLSIPRDSRIPVKGKLDKANHAHSYGGTKLAMKTIRDYTGLDIDYYVKVDYNIVKDIVDAIGGVEIDVPLRMKYDDPTAQPPLHIDIQKGLQVLDGQNAVNFLRFRHSNNYKVGYPDGDLGRIKTQQYFMKELIKQAATPSNIVNLGKLVKTYYNNVDTNIPLEQIVKGIVSLDKFNLEEIRTETVPGYSKTINRISYYIPNEEELQEIIDKTYFEYKEFEVNEVNQMSE